jgi:hypothetical protein
MTSYRGRVLTRVGDPTFREAKRRKNPVRKRQRSGKVRKEPIIIRIR